MSAGFAFALQTDSLLVDIATGPVSQERLSAGQQPQTSIMLDGIKIEDHPLRSGQATLGVMLGEFLPTVGNQAVSSTCARHTSHKRFGLGVTIICAAFLEAPFQNSHIPAQITHGKAGSV